MCEPSTAQRSSYGVYALNRRAAEATALREWATAALAGAWADRPVIACGDLNDTPRTPSGLISSRHP